MVLSCEYNMHGPKKDQKHDLLTAMNLLPISDGYMTFKWLIERAVTFSSEKCSLKLQVIGEVKVDLVDGNESVCWALVWVS